MSLEGLQERLTALQETTAQLRELIDRLAGLKFVPGSVPLRADEENTVSAELGSEISQILREEEDELEILREEVEDLRPGRAGSEAEHQKTRVRDALSRLEKDLSVYRVSFRQAQLSARKSLAEAQRLEREMILKSYAEPAPGEQSSADGALDGHAQAPLQPPFRKNQTSNLTEEDQQVVSASIEATRGLHRLRDNIEKALMLSTATHETLEQSSAALGSMGDSYMSLDSMLASSRQLVSTLVKSQKSDTWYLQTSLYMLLVTLAWLVFRRLLYGPLWWIVWLPLRLVFRTGVGVGSVVVRSGGEKAIVQEVSQAQGVSVEGLPDESLPTAEVAHESRDETEGDPDTLVEKVGRMVDGEGDPEPQGDWEVGGDRPQSEGATVKDEL
ncbi:related to protein transport membrane glycoprotein Sec20 [Cephalotrichum gorgonifer]|uniref:Related to protein transport membrane glycoprotein Sec20 n=1 Tax=Cephalotrichum gorgonifer TaxID=2041049 RepID=A0AAE8MUN7_9PEZI|nr:related to protein transport membrane glycoprotein Sec20 [Cephalotrichum gorgonifer]